MGTLYTPNFDLPYQTAGADAPLLRSQHSSRVTIIETEVAAELARRRPVIEGLDRTLAALLRRQGWGHAWFAHVGWDGGQRWYDALGSGLYWESGANSAASSDDAVRLPEKGDDYLHCPGVSGNYATRTGLSTATPSSTITVVVDMEPDDWTPASQQRTFHQANVGLVDIYPSGQLHLFGTSAESASTSGFSGSGRMQIKAARDLSANTAAFSSRASSASVNDSAATHLGTSAWTAATMADNTLADGEGAMANAYIGASNTGTVPFAGKIYGVWVYADGALVWSETFARGSSATVTQSAAPGLHAQIVRRGSPLFMTDGASDHMTLRGGTLATPGTGDYTVAVVGYLPPAAAGSIGRMWSMEQDAANQVTLFYTEPAGTITGLYEDGTNIGSGSVALADDGRAFCAAHIVDRSDNTFKVRVNGTASAGNNISSFNAVDPSATPKLGVASYTSSGFFRGSIAAVAISTSQAVSDAGIDLIPKLALPHEPSTWGA